LGPRHGGRHLGSSALHGSRRRGGARRQLDHLGVPGASLGGVPTTLALGVLSVPRRRSGRRRAAQGWVLSKRYRRADGALAASWRDADCHSHCVPNPCRACARVAVPVATRCYDRSADRRRCELGDASQCCPQLGHPLWPHCLRPGAFARELLHGVVPDDRDGPPRQGEVRDFLRSYPPEGRPPSTPPAVWRRANLMPTARTSRLCYVLLAQEDIAPAVGRQVPLADAAKAHELASDSSVTGKSS
jgi:hypothetical protein